MNIKLYLLTLLIIGAYSVNSHAQVSYNKRAMGIIGTAPDPGNFLNGATLDDVDKSTGTLRIGIPLYEIKVNDITLPISLNYTALGLKVGQEAGVAGMGWELSAGGKIITNVQGKPDDDVKSTGMYNHPIPEPFNYSGPIDGPPINQADRDHFNNMVDGKWDNAWDTYTYILPNGGGSFTANGLTYPYDPSISVSRSQITTSDGLVYNFAGGDQRRTSKISNYVSSGPMAYNNGGIPDPDPAIWYDYDLYKITSTRFKDVVNFKYKIINDPTRLGAKTRINVSESLPAYREVIPTSPNGGVTFRQEDKVFTVNEPLINKTVTDYLRHTVLDTIDYPTGMVVFDYWATDVLGRDVLYNIRIYKKTDNGLSLLKKYEFDYFTETGPHLDQLQYGHYLKEIKVYDANNVYQDHWTFGYTDFLPVVPNSNSKAQDRWGFYNGVTTNYTLLENPNASMPLQMFAHYPINSTNYIPCSRADNLTYYDGGLTQFVSTGTGGTIYQYKLNYADRRFSFNNALMGTLINLTTPTGAYYEYNYEPHYYSYLTLPGTPDNAPSQAVTVRDYGGGIRISSIIKNRLHDFLYYGSNTAETAVKKIYHYGNATPGDGFGSSKEVNGIGQVTIPYTVLGNLSAYYDTSKPVGDLNFWQYVKNFIMLSHPVNDLVQYHGSYVMYTSVTELLTKVINNDYNTLGKTQYYSSLPKFDPNNTPGGYLSVSNYGGFDSPYPGFNVVNGVGGQTAPPPANGPYLNINTGIQYESGAGVFSIDKFTQDPGGSYRNIQSTTYSFEDYPAPQNSSNHLMSYYISLAGQASGPVPSNALPGDYYDPPVNVGSASNQINIFSAAISLAQGTMDYVTRSYLYDQGLLKPFPGQYDIHAVDMNKLSYCRRKISELVIDHVTGKETHINYKYENFDHMLPTLITKNSTLDTTFTRIYYPQDYVYRLSTSTHNTGFLTNILSSKMGITEPISQYTSIKTGSPRVEKVIGGTINTFKVWDNAVVPDKVYSIRAGNDYVIPHPPVNETDAPLADPWSPHGIDTALYYKQEMSYDMYKKGQVYAYTEGANKPNIILWGYHNQYPVAKITNSGNLDVPYYNSADVAYTSFEAKDTCNWLYAGNPLRDTTTISGKNVYNLASGAITKVNATPAGSYIVSYWYKSGSAVTVAGGTIGAAVIKSTLGAWTLAEREVSNVTGTLTISGTGYIDELRFYPKYSQMITYTYDPPIGITSVIDATGRPQYYEYDNSQRLMNIRDHNGNILKSYKYIIGSAN